MSDVRKLGSLGAFGDGTADVLALALAGAISTASTSYTLDLEGGYSIGPVEKTNGISGTIHARYEATQSSGSATGYYLTDEEYEGGSPWEEHSFTYTAYMYDEQAIAGRVNCGIGLAGSMSVAVSVETETITTPTPTTYGFYLPAEYANGQWHEKVCFYANIFCTSQLVASPEPLLPTKKLMGYYNRNVLTGQRSAVTLDLSEPFNFEVVANYERVITLDDSTWDVKNYIWKLCN